MTIRRRQNVVTVTTIVAGLVTVLEPYSVALAMPIGATRSAVQSQESVIEDVALRSGVARRGNININRNLNVNRNVTRNVNRNVNVNVNRGVVRTGAWVRPDHYWWRPGGAVVAGASVGFVTAATAAAWAGAAPRPNMCWYYTDASRQQGFWDACP
jgi:hypothetical protein